jgi:FAD/FMN-containing dehydrogenase
MKRRSGGGAEPSRAATAYAGVDYARLQAVKAEYDPANLFRLNHNIPPRPGFGRLG